MTRALNRRSQRAPSAASLAVGLAASALLLGCGSKKQHGGDTAKSVAQGQAAPKTAQRAEFRLFAFGRVLGTIAPCGCTTEPLGGVQYAFGYMQSHSEPGARAVLEPGSFLYPEPSGPDWPEDDAAWTQARDRAALLSDRFGDLSQTLVSGIGPTDLASPSGADALMMHPLPRVAANVSIPVKSKLHPHRILELEDEGVTWTVGVTAVVDPALDGVDELGEVTPAPPALRREIEAMRSAGADFTVVMAHGERSFAQTLAREVDGVDMVVVGVTRGVDRERLGTPPVVVDGTHVVEPGTQLQTITELRLSVNPAVKGVPAASQWTVAPPKSVLAEELARLDARLDKFEADPEADPAFVGRLRAERTKLASKIEAGMPAGDAVAVLEQVKITCKLPPDDEAKKALQQYTLSVAKANKARFEGVNAPPAPQGAPSYAGTETCSDCHDEAQEFWETTVHASAYQTLVDTNQQYDLECVGCHVTGFRKPGGSEVVENEGLKDVQCEVCHGPGSLHAEDGGGDLSLIELYAPAELCATECHTPEHSDTFDYVAYLRDILGPGHGEAKRKELGDGPTGHELRQAGLAKAGGSCKKTM